ncbi:MAG: GntR family transcriptional regulator [Bryobacteraceae bacterium]
MSKFDKILPTTLRNRIAEEIRSAILDGSLKPGERIIERKLMTEFGASLGVIREALVELETEGFIVKRPNADTRVLRITVKEAAKIFALRRLLEPYAAGQAAVRATSDQVTDIEVRLEKMIDMARQSAILAYMHEDYGWHEAVWTAGNNPYIRAALRRCVLPLSMFAAISGQSTFDLVEDAVSHTPVVDAIKRRDAAAAEAVMRERIGMWEASSHNYLVFQPVESSPS